MDFMGEAFKPLGVYINCFQPTLDAGDTRDFTVMMVNDEARPQTGDMTLSLETRSGKVLARSVQAFDIEAAGSRSYQFSLAIPQTTGECVLKAVAQARGKDAKKPTICRRWLSVVAGASGS
jgi:hypothetical protein